MFSVYGRTRLAGSASLLDVMHMASSVSIRNFLRVGSCLSVFGMCRLGSCLSVLDCMTFSSSLSLRCYSRFGSTLSVMGMLKQGSNISVLDAVHLASSVSCRSFARLASACSVISTMRFGSTISVLDSTRIGSSLSLRSMMRLGSTMSIFGVCRLGSAMSCLDYLALGTHSSRSSGTIFSPSEVSLSIAYDPVTTISTVTGGILPGTDTTVPGQDLTGRRIIAATRLSDGAVWVDGDTSAGFDPNVVLWCGGDDASGCSSITLAGTLPSLSVRSMIRMGSTLSVYGMCRLGSTLSVFNGICTFGSSVSLRQFYRFGSG